MRPFATGCWTCKLRHRKCDLKTPACRECRDRCIPCHGYGPKPVWMDGAAAERQELKSIKKAVKRNVQNLRKAQKRDRQAVRETTPVFGESSPREFDDSHSTVPAQALLDTGYSPSLRPEHVAEEDHISPEHNPSSDTIHANHEHAPSPVQEETNTRTDLGRRHSASSSVFRPESAYLVMHYLDHVFYWQFPYFQSRSRLGNRGWLLMFLSNGGPLSHAALALSALHRNSVQASRRQDYMCNQEAFEYHSRALRELCDFSRRTETDMLLSDKSQLAEFVASSLMLISFEVFNGAEYDWLPHLDAVTTVLSMHSPEVLLRHPLSPNSTAISPVSMNHDSSDDETQPDFDFLIAQAIWFDILACVSTGRVPRIQYRKWLEASNLDMADLMGCFNWVMIAIGDLAHLQAWKKNMKEQQMLSVPELVMRGRSIDARIQDGISMLNLAIEEDAHVSIWVSHMFALASLVLSSTIVSGPWASLPEIMETIERAVDVLRNWPRAISLQGLVWPLCVIGCMAKAEHQGFFESLLTKSVEECGGFENSGTVLRILKESWALQRQGDGDGIDLALQTGIRVLPHVEVKKNSFSSTTTCIKNLIRKAATARMKYERMPIEIESPEEYGYDKIKYNLSESSVTDQTLDSLDLKIPNLTLLYNEHRGETELRKLIADDANVNADDVLITSGAAGALFIITTSQLGTTNVSESNHLVVVRPNYATNLETPKAVGCEISYIDVTFETGFHPNIDDIEAAIKPNTRLVSVTCPHNPTGTSLSREALNRLVAITKQKGVLFLVDETYRDIAFGEKLPVAASLGDHVLSIFFLAAKEQISISGSVINEWIATQVLSRRRQILSDTTNEMKHRLGMVESWIESEELLEWVKPTGGVVCFPRIKQEPKGGLPAFYDRLLKKYATYVGPGHWFEMSDSFFRLGYGWPTREELEGGMKAISAALRDE
ncbi:hypothetical protein FSARC_6125 [Fusarium sarcochroum]|uniref:Zn(2)-C6 fungal-type domain-containing protein n=1 Tax=Fusarium sarcochroum TaxID=1208366 RepID=A0A8H4X9Q1_9HYPO|nr:hypothetical protein FSARC_6125 [Fusarium sarcochroum]